MSTRPHPPPSSDSTISRRAMIAAGAWSVPAVALVAATPAFAASGARVSSVSAPNGSLPGSGTVAVSATVLDGSGAAVAGESVSFSGPSGATFSPVTATTNASGVATTSFDLHDPWAVPGSTTTVTASIPGSSVSGAFTVLGSNVVIFGQGYTATPTQTGTAFPSPVRQVATSGDPEGDSGSLFSVALLEDGTVWAAGTNEAGQLGDGTTTSRSSWAQVAGIADVTHILTGLGRVVVLRSDGTVWNWGRSSGTMGAVIATSPVQVPQLTSVTQIAHSYGTARAEPGTSFALRSDGTLWAWGVNTTGNAGVGLGAPDLWNTPVRVSALGSAVVQVGAGRSHAGAVLSDGTVRTWGSNAYGQLADGTTTDRGTPVAATGLTDAAVEFAANWANSFVRQADGSVRGCGYNDSDGELGNGLSTPTLTSSFVALAGLSSGVTQISGTVNSGTVLLSDGTVRSWGWNLYGQLGDGTTTSRLSPATLETLPSGRRVRRLGEGPTGANTLALVLEA
ncbi:Ig-like domain-containing protein [Microbacterium testaceum]|uniref:Ig-like domain-containing protein n=1 Tax=Microbacterium testaceum TaxID=2033 RepID=UPI001246D7C4|nr:Ig-like domain-containing protein [Microbacterium testaceum]